MKSLFKKYGTSLMSSFRTIILFEFLFKGILILLIVPLMNQGFDLIMNSWKYSYITLKNITEFLLYPYTLLFLILFFFLIGIFTILELSCLISYYRLVQQQKNAKLFRMFIQGISITFKSITSKKLMMPITAYLFSFLTNIPLIIGILLHSRIPKQIIELIFKIAPAKHSILILFISIIIFSYLNLFTFYFYITEGKGYLESFRLSRKLLKKRNCKTIAILTVNYAVLFLLTICIYFVTIVFVSLFITAVVEKDLVLATFLSIYRTMNFVIYLITGTLCFVCTCDLIYTLYIEYKTDTPSLTTVSEIFDDTIYPSTPSKMKIISILLILIVFINGAYLGKAVQNQSFYFGEALEGIQVTSHRGNSSEAPENTLPALESAIDMLADYAEIDIQETKDGVLVLMHDKNLYRTTGNTARVYELNYDEIRQLDAGSWFRSEFEGTHIPTLEEALALCKGKIKLNIEVKTHGHPTDIVEKLLELIDEYDFEQQCVISSSNYKVLKKVKELKPELQTGYILSVAYGDFYDKDYIDFLSMKSNFVTERVIENAHSLGKKVHVWTVNTKSEFLRMKELGADCIITDYPVSAREILFAESDNEGFVSLIKKIMKRDY